jgi:glutamate decarboxylase
MISKKHRLGASAGSDAIPRRARYLTPADDRGEISKYEFPTQEMPPRVAYQLIHDELSLDGNPFLNLASFVHTWMEPEADRLVIENISKNIIDVFEYPETDKVIHQRLVNMMGRLFNGHDGDFTGTATVGSSEAIMLGLLAHKWTWKNSGRGTGKPNVVFGSDAHVCWDKFALYFDVEPRRVPIDNDRRIIMPEKVANYIDENTICVGCILGTTFTGEIDPIAEIDELLEDYKNKQGWNIPIHVDAASGGFIMPFTEPDFKWDFRLGHVRSINVSGHKYGMTYAGLGWLVFKEEKDLPEDLIFKVNYLGEEEHTYTLNFSRGSAMLVAQYYNILRFGRPGYTRIMKGVLAVAQGLAQKLGALKCDNISRFVMLNDGGRLPIVAFRHAGQASYTLMDLSHKLREKGWIVPAYNLPENAQDIEVMRIVVRENFTADMAGRLVDDIENACRLLEKQPGLAADAAAPVAEAQYHIC